MNDKYKLCFAVGKIRSVSEAQHSIVLYCTKRYRLTALQEFHPYIFSTSSRRGRNQEYGEGVEALDSTAGLPDNREKISTVRIKGIHTVDRGQDSSVLATRVVSIPSYLSRNGLVISSDFEQ